MQAVRAVLLLCGAAAAQSGPAPAVEGCAVAVWGNCHAEGACCASSRHSCFRQNDHYAQCLTECPPSGWQCSPTAQPVETAAPTTASPVTPAPTTSAPSSASPTSAAPTTTTAQPTSGAPTSASPTTAAPTGENGCSVPLYGACHTTGACCATPGATCFSKGVHYSQCLRECPGTAEWDCTKAPSTAAPSSAAPSTAAPSTAAPTTSTAAPSTGAPSTAAPSTSSPTSASPTTAAPSTAAPTGANGCTVPMGGNCQAASCCAHPNATCFVQNEHYAQCLETCPAGWDCSVKTPAPAPVAGCTVPKWGACHPAGACCATAGWACVQQAPSSYWQCLPGNNAATRERDEKSEAAVPLAGLVAGAAVALAACAAAAVVIARRQRRREAAPEQRDEKYAALQAPADV